MSLSEWLLHPWSSELLFVGWFLSCELTLLHKQVGITGVCSNSQWPCQAVPLLLLMGVWPQRIMPEHEARQVKKVFVCSLSPFKVSVMRWPRCCCCQELEWAGTPRGLGEKHLSEDPKSVKVCTCPTPFHTACHSQYFYNLSPGWVIPQWWPQSWAVQLGDASWPPT